MHPFLNQFLPRLVCRMILTGDDELRRALRIGQQTKQSLRVVQKQVRSLVGREAACKAQRQSVGMEKMLCTVKLLGRRGSLGGWLHRQFDLDIVFTWRAVVIAAAVMSFPLLVRSARVGFQEVNRRYEQMARTLGAGEWRGFWKVSLPLAARAVCGGGGGGVGGGRGGGGGRAGAGGGRRGGSGRRAGWAGASG